VIDLVSWGEEFLSLASGPLGLVGVFSYSFLVAFILPMPGEIVLALPIDLGISYPTTLAIVIGVSSLGKAIGSLTVLRIGEQMSHLDPIETVRKRLDSYSNKIPFSITIEQDNRIIGFVNRYGYVGLSLALAVPLMPDTAVIYAFSVVKIHPIKFALAAFIGTVFRLLAVVGLVEFAFFLV
jgi:membrane protein YqaA with SNARE-associated domain